MEENLRIIISGGGTGGHIFPAVSIANAIKEQHPEAEILFVGAEGRMEMQRVPAAGYPIKGLPVAGFDRKNLLKNVSVLFKLVKSQLLARKIIKDFKPHAAVGVGGYASGPTLKMAGMMGIPTLIQEQNSYAGVTNKLLAKKACKICVAYDGMERFFEKDKIILTGNPVRQGLRNHHISREEAIRSFGLDPSKKTILIVGGSLGARTINNCVMEGLDKIKASGAQFIWQTGKIYIGEARAAVAQAGELPMLHVTDFISDMAAAYSAADLITEGAGSRFHLLSLFVVETCHSGSNLMWLKIIRPKRTGDTIKTQHSIKDAAAKEALLDKAVETVKQPETLKSLSTNIAKLAFTDSANVIAREVFKLADKYRKENGR